MSDKRRLTIKDTITIGVLAGMCAIATSLKIPLGVGAMVHLGTAFMFTVAIVQGGVYAGLSAAIGSAFFDLLMGFSPYTPWSFFIKGIAGLLAGTIAHAELLKKPVELLDAVASTVSALGRRLRDGFAYESLLELQTEARAIFSRLDGTR